MAFSDELEGLERITLTSVGIDIGSSTSHIIFSRLTLRREGGLSGRFRVAERRVLYESPIMLTPYVSQFQLDAAKLQEFITRCYADAKIDASKVDTGAVILTGEALKKENAQPISEFFAAQSGKFICASAGPNHECVLAAHGSGAFQASAAEGTTVLNVDMGGGTTKFTVIRDGVITELASVNIGARLIAIDEEGVIQRLEDAGRIVAADIGRDVDLGTHLDHPALEALAARMAEVLFDVMQQGSDLSGLASELMITPPLQTRLEAIDSIFFSGGVSEYVYDREATNYGDLGRLLGVGVRAKLASLGIEDRVRTPIAGIRATVIGAGEYTVQASGTTCYFSNTDALPVMGLKVLRALDSANLVSEIRRQFLKFDIERYGPGLALSVQLPEVLNYPVLRDVAEQITEIVSEDSDLSPVYLMLDADVAKSLGRILKEELALPQEVIVIDGIEVEGDLDYVDIGKPLGITEVVPVTVKSLVFPTAAPAD
ncbi:MAG: recombinase [Dehalococcoidia bacterium]|nr:recombinase [Dehalococcoidia bacterium]